MKSKACGTLAALAALLLHGFFTPVVRAQTPASAAAPPSAATAVPAKIDPAKEADIRRLLELTGPAAAIKQGMDTMQENMRPAIVGSLPPGDYREKLVDLFLERFRSKLDIQHIQDMAVPLYDKYLSDDDIKGLIQFYSSPLGKTTLAVLPKLTAEMQAQGMQWGQEMARQSMAEVLADHPEIAKAVQDAARAAPPK